MNSKLFNRFRFLMGLVFIIMGLAMADFDLSQMTILRWMPIIMGIGLMFISVLLFFKQRGSFNKD